MAKTATLIATSNQRPYAGAAEVIVRLLPQTGGRLRAHCVLRRARGERNAGADTPGAAGTAKPRGGERCARPQRRSRRLRGRRGGRCRSEIDTRDLSLGTFRFS